MTELRMVRGDTLRLDGVITLGGVPAKLAGTRLWFTAKRSFGDTDEDAVVRASTTLGGVAITDPDAGAFTVTLAPRDTAGLTEDAVTLVYDVQWRDLLGDVWTVARGTLAVAADVTRSAS